MLDASSGRLLHITGGILGASLKPGATPLAVDKSSGHVFVVNGTAYAAPPDSVTALDTHSGAVVRTTRLHNPYANGMAIDPVTNRAFVASARHEGDQAALTTFDATSGRAIRVIGVGQSLNAVYITLGVDRRTGHAYVVDNHAGVVTVLDTRTGSTLRTVPVGRLPLSVAVDARTHRAFVTNGASHTVTVLDTTVGH